MSKTIRVLVVDDSRYMRYVLTEMFNSQPDMEVVGAAQDGIEALEIVKREKPDVISLDIEMPRMNGLTFLEKLMPEQPTPVVMFSAYTKKGSKHTIKALELGAVDFVSKPLGRIALTLANVRSELIEKVRTAASISRWKLKRNVEVQSSSSGDAQPRSSQPDMSNPADVGRELKKIIVIGCSTGGPNALVKVLSNIPADLQAGFIVVQHMPAGFTRELAERLDRLSKLTVKEAQEGDRVRTGLVLIAPGDYHLQVGRRGVIHLFKGPMVCGVRPSANITMESVARVFKNRSMAVVLTGMGEDGVQGAGYIKDIGGSTIAEHESTCIVYGMPAALIQTGKADMVLPLDDIPAAIVTSVEKGDE